MQFPARVSVVGFQRDLRDDLGANADELARGGVQFLRGHEDVGIFLDRCGDGVLDREVGNLRVALFGDQLIQGFVEIRRGHFLRYGLASAFLKGRSFW